MRIYAKILNRDMEIKRDLYLNKLINSMNNGMIKVITGIRRCGKSYLLFNLFANYLKAQHVDDAHIIKIDLEDRRNKHLRNPDALLEYIDAHVAKEGMHYVLLDEIQHVDSKFLSNDVITEFRGRGDEIRVAPLSFREFLSAFGRTREEAMEEYLTFGGLPQIASMRTGEEKRKYLYGLFKKTYLTDILERYKIKNEAELEELIDIVASSIGGLVNPTKLADTFKSVKKVSLSANTIKSYLDILQDVFMIEKSLRYDIKGKKYINTPAKYYFSDLGLRNARLNFRQAEKTHLMENVVYNELLTRGFNVDAGVVQSRRTTAEGKSQRSQLEIDFVCNQGSKRYYVQSAYSLPTQEKIEQEEAPLRKTDDFFKRIIVTGDDIIVHRNEAGITTMSIYDFLLNKDSLDL